LGLWTLWLTVKNIRLADVWMHLRLLSAEGAVMLLGANLLMAWSMNLRWWLVLRTLGAPVPYLRLMVYRTAGNAISYATPGPQFGGEPLLVYLLRRYDRLTTDTAIASVALDRLVEIVTNFTFILSAASGVLPLALRGRLPTLFALLPVGLVLAVALAYLTAILLGMTPLGALMRSARDRHRSPADPPAPGLSAVLLRMSDVEEQAARAGGRQPWLMAGLVLFVLIHWVCLVGEIWLIYFCLGTSLAGSALILVVAAGRLAFLSPMPGGIGALEASQVLMLSLLGHHPAVGLAACAVIRLRDFIFTGAGLVLTGRLLSAEGCRVLQLCTVPAPGTAFTASNED
jgi:glycosyltransferase 2 family protein